MSHREEPLYKPFFSVLPRPVKTQITGPPRLFNDALGIRRYSNKLNIYSSHLLNITHVSFPLNSYNLPLRHSVLTQDCQGRMDIPKRGTDRKTCHAVLDPFNHFMGNRNAQCTSLFLGFGPCHAFQQIIRH